MQTILLADKKEILNVEFADTNFIDGRLTIGIKETEYCAMVNILETFCNKLATKTITLKNNNDVYNVWEGYIGISNVFMNFDVGTITIWLRKEQQ